MQLQFRERKGGCSADFSVGVILKVDEIAEKFVLSSESSLNQSVATGGYVRQEGTRATPDLLQNDQYQRIMLNCV